MDFHFDSQQGVAQAPLRAQNPILNRPVLTMPTLTMQALLQALGQQASRAPAPDADGSYRRYILAAQNAGQVAVTQLGPTIDATYGVNWTGRFTQQAWQTNADLQTIDSEPAGPPGNVNYYESTLADAQRAQRDLWNMTQLYIAATSSFAIPGTLQTPSPKYQSATPGAPRLGVGQRGGGGHGGGSGGGGFRGGGFPGGGRGGAGSFPGGAFGRGQAPGTRYGWGWNGQMWGWGYWSVGAVYLYPVRTTCASWSAPLSPNQITIALAQAAKASLAAGVTQASDGKTLFSFSYAPIAPPQGANSINAQQIVIRTCTQLGVGIGVGTFADVNPRCTSNAWFTSDWGGDYWTGYMSEDNEARAYNANWVRNILGLSGCGCSGECGGRPGCPGGGGCKGCTCGCDRCRHYAWTSEMRATMDAQGLGHHPSCPSIGMGHVEVVNTPDVLDVAIVMRGPVKQNACDTRWQQRDYPPTEGPTDADIRCADAWWVTQVVPTGCGPQGGCGDTYPQGVGSMEGISYGGRPIQGFGGPVPSTGLSAPPPQGLGATPNPSATSPATVGVVAALGGTVGLLVGAAVGSEIGTGYGEVATRRAAVGGLLGMLVGTFTGAAIVAPSIQAQQGA